MITILKQASLDSSYWITKFEDIGVKTPDALKFCGANELQMLEKFARIPSENLALQSLLGIATAESEIYKPTDDVDDAKLAQALRQAGLHPSTWLPHFKSIGVTTIEAISLCGFDEYEALVMFAKTPLEKKALKSFFAIEEPVQHNDTEFLDILKRSGLDPKSWVVHFKKVNITSFQSLKHCNSKEFQKLQALAKTPFEKKALQALELEVTQDEGLIETLKKAGLNPKVWVEHFKEVGVTTSEAIQFCSTEEFDALVPFASTSFEKRALKALFNIDVEDDDDDGRLVEVLRKSGLNPKVWVAHFKYVGVTTKSLKQCSIDKFNSLMSLSKTALEKKALQSLLVIETAAEVDDDNDELVKVLSKAGLNPKIWITHFNSIGVTMPEAIQLCSSDEYELLAPMAKTMEEKHSLKMLFSIKEDYLHESLANTLKKSGLNPKEWIGHFRSVGVTTSEALKICSTSEYEILTSFSKTPLETRALKLLFPEINPEAGPSSLPETLRKVGLDPQTWLEHLKNVGVSTFEALKLCSSEEYSILAAFVKTPLENKALKSLLLIEDEEDEDNADLNLLQKLTESGLDPNVWDINFKQVGVTSSGLCSVEQMQSLMSLSTTSLEKRALKSILVVEEKSSQDEMDPTLIDTITKAGLDSKIWAAHFKRVGIVNPDSLKHCSTEEFKELVTFAKTSLEKRALGALLRIQEEMIHDETDVRLAKSLMKAGLDAKIWVPRFKEVGITSPESFKLCNSEEFMILESLCKNDLEKRTLWLVLGMKEKEPEVDENEVKVTEILKNAGLDAKIWIANLKTIGVTTPESLTKLNNEQVKTLLSYATTPIDKRALLLVVSSGVEEQTSKDDDLDLIDPRMTEMLSSAGLNPKKWMIHFVAIGVTTPEAVKYCSAEELKTLMIHAKTQVEERALKTLVTFENDNVTRLKKVLLEANLDPSTWLKHLNDVGIESPESLETCNTSQDFKKLQIFAKTNAEKKALCTLLRVEIEEEKESFPDSITPEDFIDFLRKLSFDRYFPQKFTMQDSVVINEHCTSDVSKGTFDPKNLFRLMLENVKMSNHECRKVLLYEKIHAEDDDDDDEPLPQVVVHPMDSLIALIHCADNFLRQDIYLKLSTSQLAVPLLLPSPVSKKVVFPLWAMRSIVKYWKCRNNNDEVTSNEGRIVECDAPMVSFMRFSHFGNYSKSRLLNSIISDSNHHFFFNHECEGSSVKRKFVDGLVEICWYYPTGEKSDLFHNVITFANFRGDARAKSSQIQFKFLLANSSILFVFLTDEDVYSKKLETFNSAKGKMFFLMKKKSKDLENEMQKVVPNGTIIELARAEPAAVVKSIRSKINNQLIKTKFVCKLAQCLTPFNKFTITIDEEECQSCCQGKISAQEIRSHIEAIEPFKVKSVMVPLQGPDLWHKWASLHKKQSRAQTQDMGTLTKEEFTSKKYQEKDNIRKKQLAIKWSPVMKIFINVLMTQSENLRAYFLQWLKFYLDDQSRKVLPDLQDACKQTRDKLRSKELNEKEKEQVREALRKQDEELINASFGVEHLFRELGQIYESVIEVGDYKQKQSVTHFPKIAAELLLSGQPLEIVDGDAAHIPVEWVTSVLKEVKNQIGDSRIFVLSVLGIQSTGKSTLMNTLFGVRFSVSAGRCTRGAYFQLLKLNSRGGMCDYMLIIDTEGLRAPELDSQHTQQHDNELAALVIGLAGVTIINIFGEVPADISDILQTTVHAFLRMKNAELQHKPSCQFVRHYVSNVAAGKTNEGSDRFQQTLNDMTQLAAKEEHCQGKYEQFSDVITFDNKTDVQNFPSLWEGNPPMAPVNPAYCEAAQKLKLKFFDLSKSSQALCTTQDFITRLTRLWKAILEENFVFSFRNTLEVEAHSNLDSEFNKWSWRLHSIVLKWENTTRRAILSAAGDAKAIESEQVQEIRMKLQEEYDDIMKGVEAFFENPNSLMAQTMIKWRAQYEQKLFDLKAFYDNKAPKFCQDLIQSKKAMSELEILKKTERDRFDQLVRELVSEMDVRTRTLSPTDLMNIERKFELRWKEWIQEVERNNPIPVQEKLEYKITECLRTVFYNQVKTIHLELSKRPLEDRGKPLQLIIDQRRHLNFGTLSWQQFKNLFVKPDEELHAAQMATNTFLKEVQEYMDQKEINAYADSHILALSKKLRHSIDELEKSDKHHFTLTLEYRIDIHLEASGYALRVFFRKQQERIENHPVTYLSSLKKSYEANFKAMCNATAREIASAMCLLDLVDRQMIPSLKANLLISVCDDVQAATLLSKQKIKGQMLLKLLEKKHFPLYSTYLQNISQSYLDWFKDYVDEYCQKQRGGKPVIVDLAIKELHKMIKAITMAAETACSEEESHKAKENQERIKLWLSSFHKSVTGTLQMDKQELHDIVKLEEGKNLKYFTKEFLKGIEQCQSKYEKLFQNQQGCEVFNVTKEVAESIRDNIAGCCVQCPFCKEQCERNDKEHPGEDHHCSLHRPACLGGYRLISNNVMVLDICTTSVGTDKQFRCPESNNQFVDYKNYKSVYPNWNIPDDGGQIAPYWKWFVANYATQFASIFDFEVGTIPSDWKALTEKDAERDVRNRYKLDADK